MWFQNRRTKYKRVKVGDESEQEDQPGNSKDHECEENYGNLNVTENTDDESDNDEKFIYNSNISGITSFFFLVFQSYSFQRLFLMSTEKYN